MPRLTVRPARGVRRRPSRDHGASATLVAVLLAGGVLLGMTALVVDVGKLYAEREELMSGADAAAMAVALDCANDGPGCADAVAARMTALAYAGLNARDGVSEAFVCGNRDPLPPCGDPVGNLTDCLGERPEDIAFVEVHTRTMVPGRTDLLLPPSFAQALVSGYDGTTVGACSRVAWGPPGSGSGLAVTISICEWDEATDGGSNLAPPPPAVPSAKYERVLRLHDSQGASTCPAGPSGWDAPGGFGWLDDDAPKDCQTAIVDDEYGGDTGNNVPNPCGDTLRNARADRTVLLVPVFDDITGTGQKIKYHLAGFAAFVVTGYFLSPGNPNAPGAVNAVSTLTGQHYCGGQERCLYGYFTAALVAGQGPVSPLPNLGAVVVRTIG